MARADGSLLFDTRINTNGFNRGTREISRQVDGVYGSLKKIGGAMAGLFALKGLINLTSSAIEFASNMKEVQNVVDTAFGDMSYKCEEFAKTSIQNFGMSKLAAKQYSSTYMAMGKGMELASDTASEMAINTTKRIGDVASFYNKSFSEVDTMMKSIWTGETESLKQIGVVMTETNLSAFALTQGYKKQYTAMTQAEKTQLRYAFVMQQTNLAAGDFAKTSDSWANQTRILSELWKELLGILGTGLIQALAPALKLLNTFISKLIDMANTFASVTAKLFGKQTKIKVDSKQVDQATTAEDNLAESTEKAGKAAKNNTAAFDELNVLSQTDSAGSGSGGASIGTGIDPSEITEETTTTEEEMSGFTKKLLELLKPLQEINLDNLSNSFDRLKVALEPFTAVIGVGLEWFYLNVLVPLAEWTIEEILPRFLDILAVSLDILCSVIELAMPSLMWLWENFLKPLAKWTGTFLINDLDLFIGLLEMIAGLLEGDMQRATDGAQKAFESLGKLIESVFILILGEEAVEAIKTFVSEWATRIADWWNIDVAPWFTAEKWKALFDSVKNAFTQAWDFMKIKSLEVWNNIVSVWGKAATWFENKVITPIKNAFKSGINFMIGFAESFVNLFIEGINKIIDAINSISFDLPDILGGAHIGFSLNPVEPIKLPRLASGAVIPPNGEFAAILGDQRHGRNLEAPEGLIRQILQEELGNMNFGGGDVVINASGNWGQMIRMMKLEIDNESKRRGKSLIKGLT